MSSSVTTWLTIAPDTFTAGEFSPFAKCSGTFMWILRFSSMRWKSTCRISFLNGCICTSRSSTFVVVAVEASCSGSTRGTPRCAARGRARCGRARSAAGVRCRRRRCRAPCRRGACGGSRRGLRCVRGNAVNSILHGATPDVCGLPALRPRSGRSVRSSAVGDIPGWPGKALKYNSFSAVRR